MVEDFFWLSLVAVPCGPLVQLPLRTAGELEQLVPEFFNKKQDARDGCVLRTLCVAKCSAVDVNVESASARLMARVSHLQGLSQNSLPRHFSLMIGKRHGMCDHLKAVVQRAVVLAVEVFQAVAVGDGHDLGGVAIVLSGSVHFQFYAKIAITVPTEQRLRLVVIVLNRLAGSAARVAVVAERIFVAIALTGVISLADADEIAAAVTVCVVTVIAVLTERRGFISGIVIPPDALTAVRAENGFGFQTVRAERLAAERVELILGEFFSTVGANELWQGKDFAVFFNQIVW